MCKASRYGLGTRLGDALCGFGLAIISVIDASKGDKANRLWSELAAEPDKAEPGPEVNPDDICEIYNRTIGEYYLWGGG